jgi:hypothetical protein
MIRLRDYTFLEALDNLLTNDSKSARFNTFGPQELSIVALVFGSLDHIPPPLLARIASRCETFIFENKMKAQAVANMVWALCLPPNPNTSASSPSSSSAVSSSLSSASVATSFPLTTCTSLLRLAVDMQERAQFNQDNQGQLHQCCLSMSVMDDIHAHEVILSIPTHIRQQWYTAFTRQGEWASTHIRHVASAITAIATAAGDAWPYRESQLEYCDEHITGGYTIDVALQPRESLSYDIRPIAIEVDSKRRFDRSGRYATGATRLKRHILPRLSSRWRVISVAAQDWRRMPDTASQQAYLTALLDMAAVHSGSTSTSHTPTPPSSTAAAPSTLVLESKSNASNNSVVIDHDLPATTATTVAVTSPMAMAMSSSLSPSSSFSSAQ